MDPSTGTFTTMDTYGGSLSDPMSLHKYLFANSNPIMYSDPSGHFSLAEMDAVMAIDIMLDSSYISGFLYIVDASITDPELEHHDIMGYFGALLGGFFFSGLGLVLSSSIVGLYVLALISAFCAGLGIGKGATDFANGHPIYGTVEIVASIALFVLGGKAFFDGLYTRGVFNSSSLHNSNKTYNCVNINGSQYNTELDEVDLSSGIIYEDKNAKGLYATNQACPQTESQWVQRQIVEKTINRINAINQPEYNVFIKDSPSIPTVAELQSIRKYYFRINANNPDLQIAVENGLNVLRGKYPGYIFKAYFGG